ncbi:CYB2, partial [Symbiodinium microadriaticum]
MIIHNRVYNLKPLLGSHPGGDDILMSKAGTDCTKDFEVFEHSEKARVQRDRDMLVGQLVPAENTDWSESAAVQQVVGEETSEIGRYLKYKVTDVAVAALAWYLFKTFQNRKPLSQFTYSRALRHLHLIMAVGIFGAVGTAQAASYSEGQAKKQMLWWHKQTGILMLVALVFRVIFRMQSGIPPRFPGNKLVQMIETQSLRAFYAFALLLPVSGIANEYFLKWAPGSDKTGNAEDDRRNDRLAKQSIDAHKVLGKVLQYAWLPFHLGYTTLYHYSQGRGVVRKVPDFKQRVIHEPGTSAISKNIPLSEVNRHCTPENCWVALNGKVYDLSEFMDRHPGGPTTILAWAGKDASKFFNDIHKGVKIDAYLRPEAFLGDLGVDENLMSDQFWHTLREARIVEIRQEVDRLLDRCTKTHKAVSVNVDPELKKKIQRLKTQERAALDAEARRHAAAARSNASRRPHRSPCRLAPGIDAFARLADCGPERALQVVSWRLVDLWASQPAEAQAWWELHAREATRPEQLCEALLRHGAAEFGKYVGHCRFSEAGLLREEPCGSAAEQEHRAAVYLRDPHNRARCRELAEKLAEAESQETARKRQRLQEETSERRCLEAELHKVQEEECRELSNRLAAAEAEASSKDAELRAAQSERAKCKEQCEEFASRTAAAESAEAKMRQELGQLREEHGTCQERCEELLTRLEAAEAEVSELKGRLAEAESDAAKMLVELHRLQEESQGCQARMALAAKEEAGSRELQLEKAVLQEQCEQLRQQLKETSAKAEAERSAMLGRMQVLQEELKDMYKHRIRELELQQREARDLVGHANAETSHGQEPDLAEQLGCFMPDAIFKIRSCDTEYYLMGTDLKKGSQVVSADGKTILEVAAPPEIRAAKEVVDLHAGAATLCVTPDHPVRVPDARGELDQILYLPAGQLKVGDSVVLDSGEAAKLSGVNLQATKCEVLKIVFEPDLPVAVFSSPPCIQSKGHNKEPSKRRAGEWKKGKAVVDPTDGAVSMPNTAVGSARLFLSKPRLAIFCVPAWKIDGDFEKAAEVKRAMEELLTHQDHAHQHDVPVGWTSSDIPLSEVARHNKPHDCWIAICGEVFDLTDFLQHHQ